MYVPGAPGPTDPTASVVGRTRPRLVVSPALSPWFQLPASKLPSSAAWTEICGGEKKTLMNSVKTLKWQIRPVALQD